jgi:hypothetical protein
MTGMSLVESVKILAGGRELTVQEATRLAKFQKFHGVDDSDPLIISYALMARNELLNDSLPGLFQEKVNETIELHRQTLRQQALVVAQELLIELSRKMELELIRKVESTKADLKTRWIRYSVVLLIGVLIGGSFATAIVIRSFGH